MKKLHLLISAFLITGTALAQPVNNNCADAIELTPDSVMSFNDYSFDGATKEVLPNSSLCLVAANPTHENVFFKFTATDYYHNIIVKNDYNSSNWMSPGIILLEGDCISGFSTIGCSGSINGTNDNAVIQTLSIGLVPGNEYYIYLTNQTMANVGDYSIMVTRPKLIGDESFSAEVITSGNVINGTNYFSTENGEMGLVNPGDICANTLENGYWYMFVPQVTGLYDIVFNYIEYLYASGIGMGHQIGIYDSGMTPMECDSSDFGGAWFTLDLTEGDPYFIVYEGDAGNLGMWDLEIISPITTGIENAGINEISIYPNPTSGIINLNSNEIVSIELFSVSGKLLLKETNNKIDITDYNTGIYYLKIETADGVILNEKIYKQ